MVVTLSFKLTKQFLNLIHESHRAVYIFGFLFFLGWPEHLSANSDFNYQVECGKPLDRSSLLKLDEAPYVTVPRILPAFVILAELLDQHNPSNRNRYPVEIRKLVVRTEEVPKNRQNNQRLFCVHTFLPPKGQMHLELRPIPNARLTFQRTSKKSQTLAREFLKCRKILEASNAPQKLFDRYGYVAWTDDQGTILSTEVEMPNCFQAIGKNSLAFNIGGHSVVLASGEMIRIKGK